MGITASKASYLPLEHGVSAVSQSASAGTRRQSTYALRKLSNHERTFWAPYEHSLDMVLKNIEPIAIRWPLRAGTLS